MTLGRTLLNVEDEGGKGPQGGGGGEFSAVGLSRVSATDAVDQDAAPPLLLGFGVCT